MWRQNRIPPCHSSAFVLTLPSTDNIDDINHSIASFNSSEIKHPPIFMTWKWWNSAATSSNQTYSLRTLLARILEDHCAYLRQTLGQSRISCYAWRKSSFCSFVQCWIHKPVEVQFSHSPLLRWVSARLVLLMSISDGLGIYWTIQVMRPKSSLKPGWLPRYLQLGVTLWVELVAMQGIDLMREFMLP